MATKKKVAKAPKAKKAAAPKKAAKAKKAGGKEILVVGSKVKEVIKSNDMRADGHLIEAVSEKVHAILTAGVMRAKENKRKTVTPHDL